jgi:cyclophilin family peptidyl-prolyl cis-trans isomerase
MEDGAAFDVELLVDEAPLTVAEVVRLARQGWYSGRTFHRVVPNFVLQGGSPGANEYAGADRFLRDELSSLSHARGTLGISTRGRDTGDAQLFLNLVDNPRLDYDYTVWGRVVRGLEVADVIQEGDGIRSVALVPR